VSPDVHVPQTLPAAMRGTPFDDPAETTQRGIFELQKDLKRRWLASQDPATGMPAPTSQITLRETADGDSERHRQVQQCVKDHGYTWDRESTEWRNAHRTGQG
jgi:hypothetical protein